MKVLHCLLELLEAEIVIQHHHGNQHDRIDEHAVILHKPQNLRQYRNDDSGHFCKRSKLHWFWR